MSKSIGGALSKLYGPEAITYYSGSKLNRLSFLREDYKFLDSALNHSSTRFIPFNNLFPSTRLLEKNEDSTGNKTSSSRAVHDLVYLGLDDVKSVIGSPFSPSEDKQVELWNSAKDAIGIGRVLTVFLGIDESDATETVVSSHDGKYTGRAYFAVDLTPSNVLDDTLKSKVESILTTNSILNSEKIGAVFRNPMFGILLERPIAAIVAQAKIYLDWNNRNRYCAGCGSRTMSANGGCKLICPATDNGKALSPCATRGAISNLSFPRTDSSIIVAVVNHRGDKTLVGRNRRFPPGFYSCLAGFLEPGESLEDCVRREVWEEAGVRVGRVVIHSTQPWPFPANIMIGCIAEIEDDSEEAHKIHLGHDPELADARWVSFSDIKKSLSFAGTGSLAQRPEGLGEDDIQLPPPEAIAYTLLEAVVSNPTSKI